MPFGSMTNTVYALDGRAEMHLRRRIYRLSQVVELEIIHGQVSTASSRRRFFEKNSWCPWAFLHITPSRSAVHVPRTRIERIANEQNSITADTALRLAKALGTTPEILAPSSGPI